MTTCAISSVLFDSSKTAATTVYVPTLVVDDGKSRFPCLEVVLGREAPLHRCTVAVADNMGATHKYLVVTQIGEGLPRNRALRDIYLDHEWLGSLLVMKYGKNAPFVGLSGVADRNRAKIALQRYAESQLCHAADADLRQSQIPCRFSVRTCHCGGQEGVTIRNLVLTPGSCYISGLLRRS
jgi:hypothetical protein